MKSPIEQLTTESIDGDGSEIRAKNLISKASLSCGGKCLKGDQMSKYLFIETLLAIKFDIFAFLEAKVKKEEIDKCLHRLLSTLTCKLKHCFENATNVSIDECIASQLLASCETVLDFCWQRLNTGLWNTVSVDVRFLFGCISLFKAQLLLLLSEENDQLSAALNACDLGLLMCPPLEDNILAKIASIVHAEKVRREGQPLLKDGSLNSVEWNTAANIELNAAREVKRVSCLDLQEFEKEYFWPRKPVIIEHTIDSWPSIDKRSTRKWSLEYLLRKAAFRTVPVEIGDKYTDENWSQKLMTVGQFVNEYIVRRKSIAYIAQHELFSQITDLAADFSVPDYCCLSRTDDPCEVVINAWFGPKGTVSPLHFDPNDNLFTQVFGQKYIRLYSSKTPKEFIYPHENRLLHNTSQVDIENPDPCKFPLFANAEYEECVLKEGEILFIPEKCWHFVKSLSPSFSISFWWK